MCALEDGQAKHGETLIDLNLASIPAYCRCTVLLLLTSMAAYRIPHHWAGHGDGKCDS